MFITQLSKEVRDIKRFEEIIKIIFKHELGFLLKIIKLKKFLPIKHRLQQERFKETDTQPRQIREMFDELGGAFIKLGQLLSLRPDLIPEEYCDELKKLQDDVRPVAFPKIKKEIEKEIRKPVGDLFRFFDEMPVASASVAQVHKANLKSGKTVAVKIQRPEARKKIEADIEILSLLARKIKHHFKPKTFDPEKIIEEFKKYSESELDFVRESRNIELFHKKLSGNKNVYIPKPYLELSTKKMLVMEYICGKKLSEYDELTKKQRKNIAEIYVKSILNQIFKQGIFHADPHPGNIIIRNDGKISFIDFGIIGYFDEEIRKDMTKIFMSLMTGDISLLVDTLADLDIVDITIPEHELKEDLFTELSKYYNDDLSTINIKQLFNELMRLARKDHIRFPSNFILLIKCVITTESVAQELDPEFNLFNTGRPYIEKIEAEQRKPGIIFKEIIKSAFQLKEFIEKVPGQSKDIVRSLRKGDEYVEAIDKDIKFLAKEMDKSSNRVSLGLIITAIFISSAFLTSFKQPTINGYPIISFFGFIVGTFLVFILISSILKEQK